MAVDSSSFCASCLRPLDPSEVPGLYTDGEGSFFCPACRTPPPTPDDEEWEEVYAVPSTALDAAIAERDRLADIIDRAHERLAELDAHSIALDVGEMPRGELEAHMIRALNAMLDARNILVEADPGDLESMEG